VIFIHLFIFYLQLHIVIGKTSAKVFIDCKMVAEKNVNAAGNITTDGVEVLGRMVRSRENKENSAPVRKARRHAPHTSRITVNTHAHSLGLHNNIFTVRSSLIHFLNLTPGYFSSETEVLQKAVTAGKSFK